MNTPTEKMNLCAGDWVEVRSQEEVLSTLDKRGQLDGLPFMPEMFKYCGQRFQVWKRAHKTCDTVNKTGGRRMTDAVHLQELRCDGLSHGGCQAGCMFFWKHAWLKPVGSAGERELSPHSDSPQKRRAIAAPGCTEQDLVAGTLAEGQQNETDPTYVCQATQLPYMTTLLPWWEVRQYWEDYTSGNVGLGRLLSSFIYSGYYGLSQSGIGLGPALRWLYDRFQSVLGGVPFPRRKGTIPGGQPTPACTLNLQPGELVRVKGYPEILATLDANNKNRGLFFDAEEVPYCNRTYRVKGRVSRIINEQTGKMMEFKTESVILEGVYCQARYSDRRLFCPRSIYPMWREAWLERVEADRPTGGQNKG